MLNACIVNAETFYINKNGSELTKQQYDYLIQYYDYDFLDNMKKETLDDIKKWNDDSIEKNEKYILIDTYYDFFGNVLNFQSNYGSYYDGMQGVSVRYN